MCKTYADHPQSTAQRHQYRMAPNSLQLRNCIHRHTSLRNTHLLIERLARFHLVFSLTVSPDRVFTPLPIVPLSSEYTWLRATPSREFPYPPQPGQHEFSVGILAPGCLHLLREPARGGRLRHEGSPPHCQLHQHLGQVPATKDALSSRALHVPQPDQV